MEKGETGSKGDDPEEDVTFSQILDHEYWLHRIDLGDGCYTPGTEDASAWDRFGLPENLDGKSFLEIGAFDGLLAFEAERRGADRVLATDIWKESRDDDRTNNLRQGKRGFELARAYLDSDVEDRTADVQDISREGVGEFDIVVLSGVLVHLQEPYSAIENAVSIAREKVYIGAYVSGHSANQAMVKFNPPPPGLWEMNPTALTEMVKYAGCEDVTQRQRPVRQTESPVPPTHTGKLVDQTDVFRTSALEETVDTLPAGTQLHKTYATDGAARIEYPDPQATEPDVSKFYQGWVDDDIVDTSVSVSRLHSSAISISESEESGSVFSRGIDLIKTKSPSEFLSILTSFIYQQSLGNTQSSSHIMVIGSKEN